MYVVCTYVKENDGSRFGKINSASAAVVMYVMYVKNYRTIPHTSIIPLNVLYIRIIQYFIHRSVSYLGINVFIMYDYFMYVCINSRLV